MVFAVPIPVLLLLAVPIPVLPLFSLSRPVLSPSWFYPTRLFLRKSPLIGGLGIHVLCTVEGSFNHDGLVAVDSDCLCGQRRPSVNSRK